LILFGFGLLGIAGTIRKKVWFKLHSI
jgi:hypothetical protein